MSPRGWLNRLTASMGPPATVSLLSLVANPERYDGRRVRIIGYLHLEFEGDELCPTVEFYRVADAASCIWIDATPQMRTLSDHYVIVEGQFSSSARGHLGAYNGALQSVTRAEQW